MSASACAAHSSSPSAARNGGIKQAKVSNEFTAKPAVGVIQGFADHDILYYILNVHTSLHSIILCLEAWARERALVDGRQLARQG
jgi:hypothetical protein